MQIKSPSQTKASETAYIDSLLKKPLETLLDESALIAQDETRAQLSLDRLLFDNHSTLIDLQSAQLAINGHFEQTKTVATALDLSLETLDDACIDFASKTDSLLVLRSANARVTAKHDTLSALLSAPLLLGELITLGCYEDAIDLLATVSKMQSRYPLIEIVDRITLALKPHIKRMETQLTLLLLSNNKLALFIRTVGYLKKISTLSDTQLQLLFIRQRFFFLVTLIAQLPPLQPFEHLKLYIETLREHVFDILTQYKSIFPSNSVAKIKDETPSTLLTLFACTLIESMTATFTTNLALVDSFAYLGTLYTQAMYLGLSLSRVGLDIRFSVSKCFSFRVGILFGDRVTFITNTLVSQIKPGMRVEMQDQHHVDTGDSDLAAYGATRMIQPSTLLNRYAFFSVYFNSLMQVFNECRLVVFTNERSGMRATLEDNLLRIESLLSALVDSTKHKNQDIVALSDWFAATFEPTVLRSFDTGFTE